jgi:hypothetical protein
MCKGSDSHGGPAAGAAAARVAARSCRRGSCSTRWGDEVDFTITEPTKNTEYHNHHHPLKRIVSVLRRLVWPGPALPACQ